MKRSIGYIQILGATWKWLVGSKIGVPRLQGSKRCFWRSHQVIKLKLQNFLETVEKQMSKSRVKSPVVSNERG